MIFKQNENDSAVQKRICDYCSLIGDTIDEFNQMIKDYIDWNKRFKEQSRKVHKMEHQCDVVRREIERAVFDGAFLPAYREDYIGLLETLDRVANKAEEAGDTLYLLRPDIPEPIRADFITIGELTAQAWEPVPASVKRVMEGDTDVSEVDIFVESKEQEVDKLQFEMTRRLFKEFKIEKVDALMNKTLIDQICSVSDRVENVMDRLTIFAIKRRL